MAANVEIFREITTVSAWKKGGRIRSRGGGNLRADLAGVKITVIFAGAAGAGRAIGPKQR